jgi:hypothetical protein
MPKMIRLQHMQVFSRISYVILLYLIFLTFYELQIMHFRHSIAYTMCIL